MPVDMASMAWHALTLLMEPARLGILCIGVVIGLAIGVLPGLNGIVGMAMLIPFTYNMDQHTAMALLLGIGSPELLAFTLFGLSMVATLSGRAPLKGLTAAGLGLMISMIGSRSESGTLRWTFDLLYLYDGVPLVPATLGLFSLP